jgi:transcriptional regulator with XRE-family HTH domain
MAHRGKYIRELIKKSGNNLNDIHYGLGIGRTTLFRWLSEENLSFVKMARIANFVGEDISKDFPEAAESVKYEKNKELAEEMEPSLIRDKYFATLEKYNTLLEKHNVLLEELMALKLNQTGTETGQNTP